MPGIDDGFGMESPVDTEAQLRERIEELEAFRERQGMANVRLGLTVRELVKAARTHGVPAGHVAFTHAEQALDRDCDLALRDSTIEQMDAALALAESFIDAVACPCGPDDVIAEIRQARRLALKPAVEEG